MEGGGAEAGAATGAAGGQQQERQQKQRGWGCAGEGGVGGRAASHTHISLFSLEVYTTILPQPFSAVKSGARLR